MSARRTLDIERFRKVYRLWKGGATEGERDAARQAGIRVAASAGISFEEACRHHERADHWAKPQADRAAEAREEASRQAAAAWEKARREREAEALRKYGSRKAVFSVCEREAALMAACDHLARQEPDYDPAHPDWVSKLDGWDGLLRRDMPGSVQAAVESAFPMPRTMQAAWDETRYWRDRMRARWEFEDHYADPLAVSARLHLVSSYVYDWPAGTLQDAAARCAWFKAEVRERDFHFDEREEERFADTVRLDLFTIADLHEKLGTERVQTGRARAGSARKTIKAGPVAEAVQNGHGEGSPQVGHPLHRTTAQKREAVFELLRSAEDASLSDREIARRAGVSPQTVGNLRKRAT